ncbi:MAG: isoprenylcysteine carboxylmethyltransferase family protein [Roseiflexaceae bacterium]|nr:isoprenylcysteine carboxylmethyltransferase family protein [Roseiflexaceae bacterium]
MTKAQMDLPLLAPPEWFPSLRIAQLFSVIYLAWISAEVVNQIIGRRIGGLRRGQDRGSFWAIGGMVAAVILICYGLRGAGVGVVVGAVQFVGMAFMIIGIAFRQWAVAVLGRHFTVAVMTDAAQRLVEEGPYRWVRHPSYTGSILTLIGLPLALGSWLALIPVLVLVLAAYLYRANVEEQALTTRFGAAYTEFARTHPRFFPGF